MVRKVDYNRLVINQNNIIVVQRLAKNEFKMASSFCFVLFFLYQFLASQKKKKNGISLSID